MPRRVMIFIDGSNLYHNLVVHCRKASLHYERFVQKLVHVAPDRELVRAYYYNCPLVQNEDPDKYKAQQRFFEALYGTPDFEVRLGRLQKKDDGSKLEKGVDVKLAVDMLAKAYKNHYDVAILISGDADFVEVVNEVKDLGKHVELAFFPQQQCLFLKRSCDRTVELTEDFLRDCWYK